MCKSQSKNPIILQRIQQEFQLGNIYFDSSWKGYNWVISNRKDIKLILDYFTLFPLLTKKNIDIITFKRLLFFLDNNYHFSKNKFQYRVNNLITSFKSRNHK